MHRITIAWIGSNAQSAGTLDYINIGDLSGVQNPKVDGLRVAYQQFKHHGMSDGLEPSELYCGLSQCKKLRSKVIVGLSFRLFHIAEFLQRIQHTMNGCAGEGQSVGEFLKRHRLLLCAFLNKIFQNGEYFRSDADVVLVGLLPFWALRPSFHADTPWPVEQLHRGYCLHPAWYIRPAFGNVKRMVVRWSLTF